MRFFLFSLLTLPLLAQTPHFSQPEALWAEWRRQIPAFSERELKLLPESDRARWELALRRVQGVNAPLLLPPELDKPTEALWLEKATIASTYTERFNSFYFLNRLRSNKAIDGLADLGLDEMASWPKHLRLETLFTTAMLGAIEPEQIKKINSIWESYKKTSPEDSLRAMVSWLRTSLAGKNIQKPALIEATPHAILALMDAWNRVPWPKRSELMPPGKLELGCDSPFWTALGMKSPSEDTLTQSHVGIMSRLAEGVPNPAPRDYVERIGAPWITDSDPLAQWYGFQSLTRFATLTSEMSKSLDLVIKDKNLSPLLKAMLLPAIEKHRPKLLSGWRKSLLVGSDPVARSLAVEQLKEALKDKEIDTFIKRTWSIEEYDSVQNLIKAMSQWKLNPERHIELLKKLLEHPSWTARLDAWRELNKLGHECQWPKAPLPAKIDEDILSLAQELLRKNNPVRIQVEFEEHGSVVMNLNPINAPMNVANLVLLARKGFFDGRRVPRIVPDFVVQMGSPRDTMDGGPGYNVRCENSLDWYGPGSVGMALSGMDTGGSQFFFTLNATPHLTGKYTRVGELEDLDRAMKILESLELGAVIKQVRVL